MSYAFFKQLHPPTGVEHCISSNFLSENELNLIVARTSLLQIYRLRYEDRGGNSKPVLDLVIEKKLYGNIESLNAVRFPRATKDAIILSFRDAKVSILEFEPSTNDVQVVSLHYFEEEPYKEGRSHFTSFPMVKVDVKQRCAAMLIYDTRLVIMPFKQSSVLLDDDEEEVYKEKKGVIGSYVIQLKDMGISSVKDFAFLHGYFEPTLAFLYEQHQTWVGRIAMLKDTFSITAVSVSLNPSKPITPTIWSVDKLPWDCRKLYSVPEPVGGVIVVAVNEILYFNQNNNYGLALNEIPFWSEAPPNPYPLDKVDVKLSLDCSNGAFISNDKLLLSLKGGELYIFHLITDARTVQSIKLQKAGTSVLTSCMCTLGEDLLFLGSRLGDSLLINYTEKVSDDIEDDLSRPEKKMKLFARDELNSVGVDVSIYSQDLREEEEDIYGTSINGNLSQQKLKTYNFVVCDSILNIGPINDSIVGESVWMSSTNEYAQKMNLEFVTCSGYGKNGSLCILQEGIRPELIVAFEQLDCKCAWTIYDESSNKDDSNHTYHSYLVLSRDSGTMVLETGEELQEITNKVDMKGITLDIGNVQNNKLILQVTDQQVGLFSGVKRIADKAITEISSESSPESTSGSVIISSCIVDPYCAIIIRDKSLNSNRLLFITITDNHSISISYPPIHSNESGNNGYVSTCYIFYDDNGAFDTDRSSVIDNNNKDDDKDNVSSTNQQQQQQQQQVDENMDDEDMLLYGGGGGNSGSSSKPSNAPIMDDGSEIKKSKQRKPYCSIVRDTGRLEIYELPDWKLVFACPLFMRGPYMLIHNTDIINKEKKEYQNNQQQQHQHQQSFFVSSSASKQMPDPSVVEIMVTTFDRSNYPYILALLNTGDLLIYKGFHYVDQKSNMPPIRFSRLEHEFLTRDLLVNQVPQKIDNFYFPRLKRFDSIGGRKGAFITGSRPAWLFCDRDYLRIHVMDLDGNITAFMPFHNVNCNFGFIYFTTKGILKMCQLADRHMSYDSYWPVKKIHIRCTPHKLTYHDDSKTYALIVSNKVPREEPPIQLPPGTVLDPESERAERERLEKERQEKPRNPPPVPCYDDKYELRLVSPITWEIQDRYEFPTTESVVCVQSALLRNDEHGTKHYIIVGTGYMFGEDTQCRGKVYIFETISTYSAFDDSYSYHGNESARTRPMLNLIYSKEQKGPVTALAAVDKLLLVSMGNKLILYSFADTKDLVGLAFYDASVFVTTLSVIKNYILCGDIYKSVFFLRWKDDTRQLTLLAKDYYMLNVYTSDFLVHQGQLSFLVADGNKNAEIYIFAPLSFESRGGQMLVCKGDFHIGALVEKFIRLRMMPTSSRASESGSVKQALVFGTLDGAIDCIAPVDEIVFRRLFALQNRMITAIPHFAGLNPKAWRATKIQGRLTRNTYNNVLDGELLYRYFNLDFSEQKRLARQIGTTPEQIMDNILEFHLSISFF